MTSEASEVSALTAGTPAPNSSVRQRLIERVQSRRGAWIAAALGCAPALPSLALSPLPPKLARGRTRRAHSAPRRAAVPSPTTP
jgi:hypothetical protein